MARATKVRRKEAAAGDPLWFKDAVIYEVHVRAFFDGNGDGCGDFAGLTQKLDYIHNNPVVRGLVAGPEHWRYSSAHERLEGSHPVFKCDPLT